MKDSLTYFMWGFQQHFRHGVEHAVEEILKDIGLPTKAQVVLVGFAASASAKWPICVEPEYRFFQPEHFSSVDARTDEIYRADPESQMHHSNRRLHELKHAALRDSSRARAGAEALEQHDPHAKSWFVGRSTRVGDYDVHTAIGIHPADFEAVPRLTTAIRDRFHIDQSLPAACLTTTLVLSAQALFYPDAGASLGALHASTTEVVGRSADRMMASVGVLAGNFMAQELFPRLNELATVRYEGQAGAGMVIIGKDGDPDIAVKVRLTKPVPLREIRTLRKLLEMTSPELGLLTDGQAVYGLGQVDQDHDWASERIFVVDVVGEGHWDLRLGDRRLLQCEFSRALLPAERIDSEMFMDTVRRLFTGETGADGPALWELALGAAEQAHGTMLVISQDAANEAQRLSGQALAVEPVTVSAGILRAVTSIDGAVLLSPDGTCHALGVILDGKATAKGDRSRGARFNSAARYLETTTVPTLIVLVSEDGMINILPRLRPRVARTDVVGAVEDFRSLTTSEELDHELISDARDRLDQFAFYLSEEQCDEANRLGAAYWEKRAAEGGIQLTRQRLQPNPDMNDSYFTDP